MGCNTFIFVGSDNGGVKVRSVWQVSRAMSIQNSIPPCRSCYKAQPVTMHINALVLHAATTTPLPHSSFNWIIDQSILTEKI